MALPFPKPLSLSPTFTMSRCTPEDVPQMIATYLAAFQQSKFTFWWPDSLEVMRQWNGPRFRRRFQDPTNQQFKIVDNENGQTAAFARWIVPEGLRGLDPGFSTYPDVEEAGADVGDNQSIPEPPPGANVELYHEFFTDLGALGQKWESSKKLNLSLLCTHPTYQRRGLAAALIESVLAIADAEGFVSIVDALDNAVGVYERYGFKTVDCSQYDLTRAGLAGKATVYMMLREPRTLDAAEA